MTETHENTMLLFQLKNVVTDIEGVRIIQIIDLEISLQTVKDQIY